MKLASFQILNCFGFVDSGIVNLRNKNNFIYVLGRNSSGKSSFLKSISYLEINITPSEKPNFQNFNRDSTGARLIGNFIFENAKLNIKKFETDMWEEFSRSQVNSEALEVNANLRSLVEDSFLIYRKLVEELNLEQSVLVYKTGDGSYHLLQSDEEKYKERRARIDELIEAAKINETHFAVGNSHYELRISFSTFERCLFLQFPAIYLFDQTHALDATLPPKILPSWESQAGVLEQRFIEYLGKDSVNRILRADDPDERNDLLDQIRKRLKRLIRKINDNRTNLKDDQLEISLDFAKEGIQITTRTDSKKSFYNHLSENTKFLFAYHLYAETSLNKKSILLFDEPSNGFHPTAQVKIRRFLQDLGKNNNQVIVSTHSEYLIDPDYLSSVRLMSADKDKYLYVKSHFYNQSTEKGDFLALQPIFDAIGFKYGNQLEIKNNVIITEGVTDLLYLRAFNKILKYNLDLNIAPSRGDGKIPHIVSFLISQGLAFKILIDTGEIKSVIESDFGMDGKFIYEIPIPKAYHGKTQGSGIEDCFSKEDFKKLLKRIDHNTSSQFEHRSNSSYMKSSLENKTLKRFAANYLYENAHSIEKDHFDKVTITGFSSILDFCSSKDWFSI